MSCVKAKQHNANFQKVDTCKNKTIKGCLKHKGIKSSKKTMNTDWEKIIVLYI